VPPSSPHPLLARALAVQPSQRKLAAELGMSRERLNRVINGKGGLSIKNTLRLAAFLNEDALASLRAFGYADEANLLATIYAPPKFTRAQVDVAERFAKRSVKRQRLVKALLDEDE
jgi:transcriptional regulator with XRE-family HTH domain